MTAVRVSAPRDDHVRAGAELAAHHAVVDRHRERRAARRAAQLEREAGRCRRRRRAGLRGGGCGGARDGRAGRGRRRGPQRLQAEPGPPRRPEQSERDEHPASRMTNAPAQTSTPSDPAEELLRERAPAPARAGRRAARNPSAACAGNEGSAARRPASQRPTRPQRRRQQQGGEPAGHRGASRSARSTAPRLSGLQEPHHLLGVGDAGGRVGHRPFEQPARGLAALGACPARRPSPRGRARTPRRCGAGPRCRRASTPRQRSDLLRAGHGASVSSRAGVRPDRLSHRASRRPLVPRYRRRSRRLRSRASGRGCACAARRGSGWWWRSRATRGARPRRCSRSRRSSTRSRSSRRTSSS